MSSQLGLFDGRPPRQERAAALRSFHARRQPISVDEALAGEKRARAQEVEILAWFRYQPLGHRATPSQVHAVFVGRGWPLTSVRRALTNLSKPVALPERGREPGASPPLEHHPEDRRPGPLGAKESTWSLRA